MERATGPQDDRLLLLRMATPAATVSSLQGRPLPHKLVSMASIPAAALMFTIQKRADSDACRCSQNASYRPRLCSREHQRQPGNASMQGERSRDRHVESFELNLTIPIG